MIWLGLALIILVIWVLTVLVAMVARPPSIDAFESQADLESSLLVTVGIHELTRAVGAMRGVRVISSTESALLLSVSPRLASVDVGSGEWVRIARGAERWTFQMRSKSPFNLTNRSRAIVEFERDLRMILRKHGVVKFDLYEDAAAPSIGGAVPLAPPAPPPSSPSGSPVPSQQIAPAAAPSNKWWED